jgi:hypothetical protein
MSIEHKDHQMSATVRAYALAMFAKLPEGFNIATFHIPPHLGTAPCGLYGPIMGDEPVAESEACYMQRSADRPNLTRCVDRPLRPSNLVSVIGIHNGSDDPVIFTMYGGPTAPQEPGDPHLEDAHAYRTAVETWEQHALAVEPTFAKPSAGIGIGADFLAAEFFAPTWDKPTE